MKKAFIQLTIFLLLTICGFAQNASVKGITVDTSSKENLSNTVVSLLRSKDSILVKFVRSNATGNFELKNLKAGEYIVLVTYPNYADYVDRVTLDSASSIDLGKLPIILKANLLKEVIVKQAIGAIRVKGDTTEYTADSFKVQENATVEDLLKKLPGIQVDKNGQITAQGEKVKKVLVEGEEFFGDDPTLVTQNLRADMIDKVQVYDKKSDQAQFTGIDDGQTEKTINLKMKDNKRNGYFGKINVGGGTNGYHDNQLMFNTFKNKQKLSLYGIVSNTGTSGLNWQDRNSYGESFASNFDYDDAGGGFMFVGSDNDDDLDSWDGRYNGQGYPLVQTGGIHYNNKWNDDKQNANFNYKILQLHVNGGSTTNAQYILPDTVYYNNQQEQFFNKILRNRLNGSYEYVFDTTSSIKLTADGGTDHKITNTDYETQQLTSAGDLVNKSSRTLTSTGDNSSLNSNLLWRKKLKKKGRTISFNLRENYSDNTSHGYLYAEVDTFRNGELQKQITDQYKTISSQNISFDSKLTYSEPLTKVSSLVFNYGVVVNNSNSERSSFNKTDEGKYTAIDSLYSNDYAFNVFTQRGGLNYSLFKKKLKFNIGSNVGFTNFSQKDIHADTSLSRNFVNWYPQMNFSYNFSQQRRVFLRYNGNTQQPTIQQIQPVQSNEDPLNVSIGNPDLKPAFQNNISLGFFDFKVLTERNIWTNVGYTFTQNAIGSSDFVDYTSGKRTYQAINVTGNHSLYLYADYGFKLKKLDTRIGLNGNINAGKNVSVVNNLLNTTKSTNYSFGFNINKDEEKKYSINLSSSATYTSSNSSIQTSIKTKYWSFDISSNIDVYLPLKFQVHSDCDMNFRQKTSVFDNNTNVILWNAWVGKKFTKKETLLLKASVNDLLNQNIGFDRTVNTNYISQNTYSTIQRYFLLSLVWNFTKAGTPPPQQDF